MKPPSKMPLDELYVAVDSNLRGMPASYEEYLEALRTHFEWGWRNAEAFHMVTPERDAS